jgi:C4-type Zn-finger protein
LSKTSGANIHSVNGFLGNILNAIDIRDYWQNKGENFQKVEEMKKLIAESKSKIAKIISCDF